MPWFIIDLSVLTETSSFNIDFFIFGTNFICVFALNLAVFLFVGKTSVLIDPPLGFKLKTM